MRRRRGHRCGACRRRGGCACLQPRDLLLQLLAVGQQSAGCRTGRRQRAGGPAAGGAQQLTLFVQPQRVARSAALLRVARSLHQLLRGLGLCAHVGGAGARASLRENIRTTDTGVMSAAAAATEGGTAMATAGATGFGGGASAGAFASGAADARSAGRLGGARAATDDCAAWPGRAEAGACCVCCCCCCCCSILPAAVSAGEVAAPNQPRTHVETLEISEAIRSSRSRMSGCALSTLDSRTKVLHGAEPISPSQRCFACRPHLRALRSASGSADAARLIHSAVRRGWGARRSQRFAPWGRRSSSDSGPQRGRWRRRGSAHRHALRRLAHLSLGAPPLQLLAAHVLAAG